MKKLAVFFVILISLIVVAGCNNSRKNVTRFTTEDGIVTETSEDEVKTTITKLEDGEKPEVEPIEIPTNDKMENPVNFGITSLENNIMQSDKGYHLIQGTTPSNTDKIVVNDYALSKYKTGETKWSYIAAASLGNLRKGENNYTVKALDNDGNEIASESFTIVYNGIDAGILAPTGNSLNLSLILTAIIMMGLYSLKRQFKN